MPSYGTQARVLRENPDPATNSVNVSVRRGHYVRQYMGAGGVFRVVEHNDDWDTWYALQRTDGDNWYDTDVEVSPYLHEMQELAERLATGVLR